MRIPPGADAPNRPQTLVPGLLTQRPDEHLQVSEHGATHRKQMGHDLEASIDKGEESAAAQCARFLLWGIAMMLFGALLVFGLDKLEALGRKPMAPITAPH